MIVSRPPRYALVGALLLALLVCGRLASVASAAEPQGAAWWHLQTVPLPTTLKPHASEQVIEVLATNLGSAPVAGPGGVPTSIKLSDVLPPGLKATGAPTAGTSENLATQSGGAHCTLAPLACEWQLALPPFSTLKIDIPVEVESTLGVPSTLTNEATVQGGESEPAEQRSPVTVAESETGFGIERYEVAAETDDGASEVRAGAHPFQLTTTLNFDQTPRRVVVLQGKKVEQHTAPALPKDVSVQLPPGLVANAAATARCSAADFSALVAANNVNGCPADTAIGVATVLLNEPKGLGFIVTSVPVFNLVPGPGEPARFGFETTEVPVVLDTSIEAGGDYHAVVTVKNASQAVNLLGSLVTIWGAPGDSLHDSSRGWGCLNAGFFKSAPGGCHPLGVPSPPAFLTLPTVCGAQSFGAAVDSWSEPAELLPGGSPAPTDPRWRRASAPQLELEGCQGLPFAPSFEVQPDSHSASTPSGLTVNVTVPQDGTLAADGLAEADVRDTVLALPAGLQPSPGAATGLEACMVGEAGFAGDEGATPPLLEEQLGAQGFTPAAVSCPDGAKIGHVEIVSPLLEEHLSGAVYLASQDTNPFASPLVLYLVAEAPKAGVRVKLAGSVTIDPSTGQLTSTFDHAPPLPFSELTLHLFDGPRASQATPALCGSYESRAHFTPSSGGEPVDAGSAFAVNGGAEGRPCQTSTPLSFQPTLSAGPTVSQAGAFTHFTLTLGHPDSDQPLAAVRSTLPPGAAAMLSSITPCQEPPIGTPWRCGADSLIGHATSSSGFGPEPFTLGGDVYLTSGYNGAPFGLLVSTNAEHAGPFNLGVIDVRSRIDVDRSTAAVTVTTDPGPRDEALPTRIKGVPVDLKALNVTVDREGFEFNPTSCAALSTTATVTGSEGAASNLSSAYPVTGCSALPFTPKLTASTQGAGSKIDGASLTVHVSAQPGQANIAKTKLTLPLALPSRLTTIQKACLDTVFEANPATCPEGSNIGTATVHTPVLKSALTGPAYLVSHGNAAFPDVEFVLQGEGIVIVLDGQTDIKKGITTSTFNAVPDAPVSSFEAVLPEGPHSALGVYLASGSYDLCGSNLQIPTTITGQNGAVIQQSTKVAVTGCKGVKSFKATRARSLAAALRACRRHHPGARRKALRVRCERLARRRAKAQGHRAAAHR